MTWVWVSLLAWFATSPLVGVAIGRAVSIAEARRTRTLTLVR
jgi:hypothetical protein